MFQFHYLNISFPFNEFMGKTLKDICFYNCDFSGTNLRDTHFINCDFFYAENETGCNFTDAILINASFVRCDLSMCTFSRAQLLGIEMSNCIAINTNFRGASFKKTISKNISFCEA